MGDVVVRLPRRAGASTAQGQDAEVVPLAARRVRRSALEREAWSPRHPAVRAAARRDGAPPVRYVTAVQSDRRLRSVPDQAGNA